MTDPIPGGQQEKTTVKFEMYKSGDQWRWRLKAANGEIIASGESYTTKQNCLNAINLVKGTNSYTPVNEV